MQLYSISIHPAPGIGYAFAVQGENPKHAIATLSYHIRDCMKKGVDDRRFVDTLKMLRKYWRYHKRGYTVGNHHIWKAVEVVQTPAIAISYDAPLIPVEAWGKNQFTITGTSNLHHLKEKLSPRTKPNRKGPKIPD